ncbi:hypothetical protein CIB84_011012, partial [Bambusicola thoracicus]
MRPPPFSNSDPLHQLSCSREFSAESETRLLGFARDCQSQTRLLGFARDCHQYDFATRTESKTIFKESLNISEYQSKLIKEMKLTFYWILALFITGTEVRGINLPGCFHVKPQVWYRAISDEEFVLQCALPDKDATSIYNNSVLKQHEVKWFWHQKDKGHLKAVEESFNVTLQGNALWFKPVRENASGIYICMIREKIPCLKIVLEVQTKAEAKCSGYGTNTLYLLAGNGNSIACPGRKCYSHMNKSYVRWYKDGRQVEYRITRNSLRLVNNEIYLKTTYVQDSGIYVCDYNMSDNTTQWTVRTAITVEVIAKNTIHPPNILYPSGVAILEAELAKNTIHPPNILYPSGVAILEAELGKPLELECRVQFGFERGTQRVIWKRDNKENLNEKLKQFETIETKET